MPESILLWNRLEPSLRNENQLDDALRFEIADALWMLTRQWQFGEFEAEDAGTASFVQMNGQHAKAISLGAAERKKVPFNFDHSPFERALEATEFIPEVSDRIEMGRHFERLLRKRLPSQHATQVWTAFSTNTRFHFSSGLPDQPDRVHKFQHAQRHTDDQYLQLIDAVANGNAFDGYALLQELKQGKQASVFLSSPDAAVDQVAQEFLGWYKRIYGQPADPSLTWHPSHLEYQAQINFDVTDGHEYLLKRSEYFGDGIDWFGFSADIDHADTRDDSLINRSHTVIPANVRFRGMPSARLWEMEDSQVDFGSIRASSTELSKMIFAEFGLVYGNDWLVAPISFPLGSVCRLTELVVTDNFGKISQLSEIRPDNNWGFFQSQVSVNGSGWLFLAGSSEIFQEDKPVEKVSFLRDEMANLVWGVEDLIASPYGGSRDANKLARMTSQLVNSLSTKQESSDGESSGEGWKYKAGTLMAENRIPFIPVAVEQPDANKFARRKVVLQRAATPRVSDDFEPVRIRPRSRLLGYNGKPEDQKPDPLFIFEEEIARTGIELGLVWKRTRWFDGQTLVWLSRRKTVGRGEIDANFRFDMLKK